MPGRKNSKVSLTSKPDSVTTRPKDTSITQQEFSERYFGAQSVSDVMKYVGM